MVNGKLNQNTVQITHGWRSQGGWISKHMAGSPRRDDSSSYEEDIEESLFLRCERVSCQKGSLISNSGRVLNRSGILNMQMECRFEEGTLGDDYHNRRWWVSPSVGICLNYEYDQ